MKKIIYLFSMLTFILTSCSSNDDDSGSATDLILPKTIKFSYPEYPEENTTSVITYNGNKIVRVVDEEMQTDYIYDGNLIVKEIVYDISDGKNDKTSEKSYSYTNGKLTATSYVRKFTSEYPFGEYRGRSVYTHQNDGTIKKESYSTNANTGEEINNNYTETLFFQNGNLIKLVAIDNNSSLSSTRTSIYEFDSKNNPFKNVLGYSLLLDEEYCNANNLIKHTYSYSESESKVYINETVYEYNANGYPTKQTYYQQDGVTVGEIQEYTY